MAEVSWPEIEKAFEEELPLIIPLGAGCKEHGFHLPMNTDYIIAEYLANWTQDNYKVLIAPTMSDSFFPAFEEYPGSSTLSFETARNYIIELCENWHKQGAKHFYVLNTGISTNKPLAAAQTKLKENGITFDFFDISGLYSRPEIKAISKQKIGTHADEIETSIMLYIKPDVVNLAKAKAEENPDKPGPLTRNVSSTDKTISVTGAWGNPTLATVEKGKITVETLKHMLEEDFKNYF